VKIQIPYRLKDKFESQFLLLCFYGEIKTEHFKLRTRENVVSKMYSQIKIIQAPDIIF